MGVPEDLASHPGAEPVVVGEADLAAALSSQGRHPVLAVGDPSGHTACLKAGATEVVSPDAPAEVVRRALGNAVARAAARAVPGAFERRYRALLGALPDVIARLRDDGTALDFYVPDEFKTEFPAEAMVGRRLADVIPADLADRFDLAVAELRQRGAATPYRYTATIDGQVHVREARVVANGEDEVLSILRDTTELERSARELAQSRAELRALAARLHAVREDERARLSREVHDVIGQGLTAIRLLAGGLARRRPDDPVVQERVDELRDVVDETIQHVRRISTDLRPSGLDDLGLVPALEWMARTFEERTGMTCIVDAEGPDEAFVLGALDGDLSTAVYRIVQEALTNVARHADAQEVAVRLTAGRDALVAEVCDDGVGLKAPEPDRQPLGIVGMRERALAAGGRLAVTESPTGGVCVRATFPRAPRPAP